MVHVIPVTMSAFTEIVDMCTCVRQTICWIHGWYLVSRAVSETGTDTLLSFSIWAIPGELEGLSDG